MSALGPGWHIRATGAIHGIVGERPRFRRSAASDRVIWGHLVPVGVAAVIEPRDGAASYYETWAPDSLYLPKTGQGAGVYVGEHRVDGGTRVGHVSTLTSGRAWIDAALLIDDSPAGDAMLSDIGEDGGRLPLSIGFLADPGRSVRSNRGPVPEILRTRAMLIEVAVVERGAFDSAVTYARGTLAGPASTFAGLAGT